MSTQIHVLETGVSSVYVLLGPGEVLIRARKVDVLAIFSTVGIAGARDSAYTCAVNMEAVQKHERTEVHVS